MKKRLQEATIQGFNERDETAFKDVFYAYFKPVFTYIERFVKNKSQSEDMAIKLFQKLWLSNSSFNNESALRSFIFSIAKNDSISFFKSAERKRQLSTIPLNDRLLNVDEFVNNYDYFDSLYEYIDKLPEQCKDVICLTLLGLSSKEISDRMGITVSTVDVQRFRAINKLRKLFKKDKKGLCLILLISSIQ